MKLVNLFEMYPFHTDTTEMPDYDDMIKALKANDEHTLNYLAKEKGKKPELVKMSPDEYIDAVVKGFSSTKENVIRERDPEKIERFARKMEGGEKFPILTLDYSRNSKRVSQEGVHRALAAKEIGVKEVPVLIIKEVK